MYYYVGLDASLWSVAVCVIDGYGRTVLERSVACEIEEMIGCLANLPAGDLRIGFEAGAMSQHLFFGLQAAGFDVVCMEARQVNAALSAMPNRPTRQMHGGSNRRLNSTGRHNAVHVAVGWCAILILCCRYGFMVTKFCLLQFSVVALD